MIHLFQQNGGALTREMIALLKDLQRSTNEDEIVCKLNNDKLGISELSQGALYKGLEKYIKLFKNSPFLYSDEKIREILKPFLTERTKEVFINADNEIVYSATDGLDIKEVSLLDQIGFLPEEVDKILDILFDSKSGKGAFKKLEFIRKKKHAVTTSIYMLSWANLIGHVILYDPDGKLRPAFMNELRGLFNLPESFTFDDFIDIKNRDIESQSTDEEKRSTEQAYLEFITKIMHLKDGVLSVYQRNYSRESFARSSVPRNTDGSRKDGVLDKVLPISSLECFADLNIDTSSGDSRTYAQRNVYISDASTIYSLSGTFTHAIFEKYRRNTKGGISGSIFYLYFLLFEVLDYEKKPFNFLKVLLIAIFDYVPIWHSLTEILMTINGELKRYSEEFHLPIYTLDQDPIEYFRTLIDSVIEIESSEREGMALRTHSSDILNPDIGGKPKKTRRKYKKHKSKRRKTKRR